MLRKLFRTEILSVTQPDTKCHSRLFALAQKGATESRLGSLQNDKRYGTRRFSLHFNRRKENL